MLAPTKVDLTTKKQSYKRSAVGAKGAGGINMIIILFECAFSSLRIWDN